MRLDVSGLGWYWAKILVWLFLFLCMVGWEVYPFFHLLIFSLQYTFSYRCIFFLMSHFSSNFMVAFLLEGIQPQNLFYLLLYFYFPNPSPNKTQSVGPAQNPVLFHLEVAAICSVGARWAGMWQMWKERQECSVCTENIAACCIGLLSPQTFPGPEEPKY